MPDATSMRPFSSDDERPLQPNRSPIMRAVDAKAAVAIGSQSIGALAVGAMALGALALGAVAIGAFSIGRLSARRVVIQDAHLHRLRIDHLTIGSRQRSQDEI